MSEKRAKAVRRRIYGDLSPRYRQYFKNRRTGQIIADDRRRLYKYAKRGLINV